MWAAAAVELMMVCAHGQRVLHSFMKAERIGGEQDHENQFINYYLRFVLRAMHRVEWTRTYTHHAVNGNGNYGRNRKWRRLQIYEIVRAASHTQCNRKQTSLSTLHICINTQ